MDRFGRTRTVVPGFAGVAIAVVGLALTGFSNLSVNIYLAMFLVTVLAQGVTGGSMQIVGSNVAPPETRDMFVGVWRFTGQGGVTLSPVIFAALAGAVSYGASSLVMGAARGGVAVLVAFRVPETGEKKALTALASPHLDETINR